MRGKDGQEKKQRKLLGRSGGALPPFEHVSLLYKIKDYSTIFPFP